MMRRKILAVLAVTLFIATAILPMIPSSEGSSSDDSDYAWATVEISSKMNVRYEPGSTILWVTITEKTLGQTSLDFDLVQQGGEDVRSVELPRSYVKDEEFGVALGKEGSLTPLTSEKDAKYLITCTGTGFSASCMIQCLETHKEKEITDDGTTVETKTTDPIVKEEAGVTTTTTVTEVKTQDVSGNVTESTTETVEKTWEDSEKKTHGSSESTTTTKVTDASGQVKDNYKTKVTSTSTGKETEDTGKTETVRARVYNSDGDLVSDTTTQSTTTKPESNKTIVKSSSTILVGNDRTYVDATVTTETGEKVETVTTNSTTTIEGLKTVVLDQSVTTNNEVAGKTTVNTNYTTTNKDNSGNVVSVIEYGGTSTHTNSNTNVVTKGTATVKDVNGKEIEDIVVDTSVTVSADKTETLSTETTTDKETSAKSVVKTFIIDESKSTTATVKAVTTIVNSEDSTNATGFVTSDTTVKTDGDFDSKYVSDAVSHATSTISTAKEKSVIPSTASVDKYVNYNTANGEVQATVVTETINQLLNSQAGFKISGSDCTVAYDYATVNGIAKDTRYAGKPLNVSAELSGDLTAAQRRVIGDNAYLNIVLKAGADTIVSKFAGNCTFTMAFNGIAGMNYELSYVDSNGNRESIPFVFDAFDGILIGQTSHNSVYAVFPAGYTPPSEEKDNTMIIVAVVVILIILLLLAYYYDKQRKAKAAASFEQPVPPQQAPAQQPVQEQPAQQQTAPATESQPTAQPAEPQQPANDTQSSWDKENKPNQ